MERLVVTATPEVAVGRSGGRNPAVHFVDAGPNCVEDATYHLQQLLDPLAEETAN